MKLPGPIAALIWPALLLFVPNASASVVLSKEIMNLVEMSGELSNMTYDVKPALGQAFIDEPDQALFYKGQVNGHDYCFGAFRGTTMTWVDWEQNFDPKTHDVCVTLDNVEQCCTTRNGFYDAYSTSYMKELEEKIRDCAESCKNKDECVVLTGHSQGGAVAAVAGLVFADLNPYVITFGQPPTLDAPCPLVTSGRWFRFVNTKSSSKVGITYDPVPMSPGLGAHSFGHMIVLGDDTSGVAYIGLDAQDFFGPLNVGGFEAHSMVATTPFPGYLDRIQALMKNDTYPIRNNGYVAGSLCSQDKECETKKCGAETHFTFNRCIGIQCTKDSDCDTDRCDSGVCIPKLGSCAPCDEASDCVGQKCTLFQCSNEAGFMDDFCSCTWDSDCGSGRCEGVAPPICEAQLGLGASCNEASDCQSKYCSWSFVCAMPVATTISPVIADGNETTSGAVPEEKSGSGPGVFLIVVGVLIAAVGGFLAVRFCVKMREGYESIPSTTMDV